MDPWTLLIDIIQNILMNVLAVVGTQTRDTRCISIYHVCHKVQSITILLDFYSILIQNIIEFNGKWESGASAEETIFYPTEIKWTYPLHEFL